MSAAAVSSNTRRPPVSARSLLCFAGCPDSAQTGYPYGFQVYDETRRAWRWLTVGCCNLRRAEDSTKRQAEFHIFQRQVLRGWFRYVWIKRWIRRERGWAAVIDRSRCTEPVWVDKGCDPNCRKLTFRFTGRRRARRAR